MKKYNYLKLDGKPLKIELVGVDPVVSTLLPNTGNMMLGNLNRSFRRYVVLITEHVF